MFISSLIHQNYNKMHSNVGYTTDSYETLFSSINSCDSKTRFLLDHLPREQAFEVMAEDIVNRSINDLIPQGAIPMFFLDYIGTDKLVPEDVALLAKNIYKTCQQYDVLLMGGKVRESSLTYRQNTINVVGTIVGTHTHTICKEKIKEGDTVYGLPSSGPHTNGYTLLNKLYSPYEKVDARLLKPHKCYLRHLKPIYAFNGIAHITDGGHSNVNRILPKGLVVKWDPYNIPAPFDDIQKRSGLSDEEMFQVFNCGIGIVFIPGEYAVVRDEWIRVGVVEKKMPP